MSPSPLTYVSLLFRLLVTVINWPSYFLNRFGILKHGVRYRLWNGMTIATRPYAIDGSALNEVWFDRSYDPNAFGVPFDWKSARNIVEAGGHIGTFTIFAAAMSPEARIVTLEPEPGNFDMLSANVTRNNVQDRVTVQNLGLGNGQPITLYTFPNDRGDNSIYRSTEGGIPVTIETVSLKDIMDKHDMQTVDYMKIDCEGAEYDALYALPSEYFSRIRMIGMEYHHFSKDPTHNSDALQKHLEKHGFTVKRHKKSMLLAWH